MTDVIIHNWIKSVTGFDAQHVIRENQVGKRPVEDYVSYFKIGGNENQYAHKKKVDEIDSVPIPDDDVEVTYTTPERIMYSVDIHSLNGERLLKDLFKSRNLLSARNILKLGNLVIVSKSETRNPNLFSDTKYRIRYQADFTFRTMNEMKETNQKILEYELHGKFGDLDTTISGSL
jgi:hypothetical protein